MKSDVAMLGLRQRSLSTPLVIKKWLLLAAMALMILSSTRLVNAQGILFIVNTTADTVVIGACESGDAGCSLRGAIQASNSHPGDDGIQFDLPAGSLINLTQALPELSEGVGITGPGADMLTVRRDTGGDYRIFNVTLVAGIVAFSGLTISNGLAVAGNGGGILISSSGATVNVINCVLSNNVAASLGGGIFNEGELNVTNSTFDANTAGLSGGGINNLGTTNVTLCTFHDNMAQSIVGGAISTTGDLNLTNSTLVENIATVDGGGLFVNDGTTNIKSSIIAGNTAPNGADVSNDEMLGATSRGFNLIGSNDGAESSFPAGDPNANGDIVGTDLSPIDPEVDPAGLQDNGGTTPTIALLFGSPAIDRGTSNGLTGPLTTDQRGDGFARTFDDPAIPNVGGDGTDIGAFEVQTAAPTPTPSPTSTPTPTPTTFGNISTRLRVETGDNVLIGGFIITGTEAKKVMVRAIGPSLPLIGALPDPALELHDGVGALLASNDNWMDAPNKQEIIDSTIPPTSDLESAILMTLDPGLYTAIVRGVDNTTGIALVEAYDLDLAADSILANISTRGLVQTDDDVMIGGIIILGTDPQEVLLRAIGPSLPLTGALADPTLELHDKDGAIIASNDDWRSDQEAEIIDTTIPPTNDAESAILMTLTPDAYTAIVRGKDNTTGVALVEAYQLDN